MKKEFRGRTQVKKMVLMQGYIDIYEDPKKGNIRDINALWNRVQDFFTKQWDVENTVVELTAFLDLLNMNLNTRISGWSDAHIY